ncbi:MAG: GNAT family N-acetyltransferase, partial [Acidobacteriota bacterium]|nr:GNAT family N-acetyltransferase [Acidobacteriota bacterium]
MVSIQLLTTLLELDALAPEWLELWHRDPQAKPFQHPAWLLPWSHVFCQHASAEPALRTLTIRRQGELIGLLPLYLYVDLIRNEQHLLLLGAGTSDYLNGLFAPACTPSTIFEALETLRDDPSWDTAHLTQILPGSKLSRALAHGSATEAHGESCSQCAAVPISQLPRKVRADVLYHRNFASGRGKLNLELAQPETSFDLLVRLHSESWQHRDQPGVLADPNVLAWHREALPHLAAANLLRFYLLTLTENSETVPIAALYALTDPPTHPVRTTCFYHIGHSTAHAELKPGTLLTALAAEHAASEGVHLIDMLRGNET